MKYPKTNSFDFKMNFIVLQFATNQKCIDVFLRMTVILANTIKSVRYIFLMSFISLNDFMPYLELMTFITQIRRYKNSFAIAKVEANNHNISLFHSRFRTEFVSAKAA